jgi:hypothetical protein
MGANAGAQPFHFGNELFAAHGQQVVVHAASLPVKTAPQGRRVAPQGAVQAMG